MTITLIILPLYPNLIDGYFYSVNMFAYTQITLLNRMVYWILFVMLIVTGGVKVLLNQLKIVRGQKMIMNISIVLSIFTVLFLAMAKEPYAITMIFLLLIIKALLVLKISKTGR